MKRNGSKMRNRITVLVGAAISLLVLTAVPSFAMQLEPDRKSGTEQIPAAATHAASGGSKSWIVALLVVAGAAAAITLIAGLVHSRRERRYAVTQW
jgi:hypothetical protein